jgi:hypothetical protein
MENKKWKLSCPDATRVSPDTIIALVRNGSTGEPRSTGYWFFGVLAADVKGEDLIPLLWGALLPAGVGFPQWEKPDPGCCGWRERRGGGQEHMNHGSEGRPTTHLRGLLL